MKEEAKDTTGEEKPDVDKANQEAIDDALGVDKENEEKEKKEEEMKKEEENKDKDKNKKDLDEDELKKFNKQLGGKVYTSEKEYDEAVDEMQKRNQGMATTLGDAGIDPKTLKKKEEEKKEEEEKSELTKKQYDETDYYRHEAIKIQKQVPELKDDTVKEMMKTIVKTPEGKINGEPSYALSGARALSALGKKVPDKLLAMIKIEKGEDPDENIIPANVTKKVMRSGGTGGNVMPEQETYKSQEELDSISDFGNDVALKRI